METPRPDFHDKRLPGILPSYFGQVGGEPSSSSPLHSAQAVCTPDVDFGVSSYPPKHVRKVEKSRTPSTGSLVKVERDTPELFDQISPKEDHAPKKQDIATPSEPISAEPCEVQRDEQVAENGMPLADRGSTSITQTLRNLVSPKHAFSFTKQRHHSLPLSSIDTSSVPAAHISNPTSNSQTPDMQSPSLTPPPSEKQEISASVQELSKLTLDAASESRVKTSTPPMTPRALSHEGKVGGARSPLSGAGTQRSEEPTASQSQGTSRKSDLPTSGARGKLAVSIAEGRNIKPAVDPYCVCVFEWNEYISKGPKSDRMDVDEPEDKKGPVSHLASIPIRRTDSDVGKPMAIPMRSRQSSTNGTGDDRMEKTTTPKWDHEAVL